MQHFGTIRAPRELIFGNGQRHVLGAVAARLGQRALVVTDERLAGAPEFGKMMALLENRGLTVRIDAGTLPDVPEDSARHAAAAARSFAPDVVIGIGGGSCLDVAKCIARLLSHGGAPFDYYGELKVPGPTLPVIAVPTTAGTGSEVTPVAVLSDTQRSLKVGISGPYLIPVASICDPELTLSCPASLTAIAGADALTHAIEAFTAVRRTATPGLTQERVFIGKNALSDHFALNAISLLWNGLEAAYIDGRNSTARARVMLGATYAGLAFGVAGTAAAHAIQYPVGAVTHTAHGAGVACLLPWVMQWNRPAIEAELEEMALRMGLPNASAVIPAVSGLFSRIGIPSTLAALGLSEDSLEWVAEQSCGIERLIQNNPRALPPSDMRKLLAAAFWGEPDHILQDRTHSQ